jgi:hypothetical protein
VHSGEEIMDEYGRFCIEHLEFLRKLGYVNTIGGDYCIKHKCLITDPEDSCCSEFRKLEEVFWNNAKIETPDDFLNFIEKNECEEFLVFPELEHLLNDIEDSGGEEYTVSKGDDCYYFKCWLDAYTEISESADTRELAILKALIKIKEDKNAN